MSEEKADNSKQVEPQASAKETVKVDHEKKEEPKPEPEKKEKAKEPVPMTTEKGAAIICPKCKKKPLRANVDGAYCTQCGKIGTPEEIRTLIREKRKAEEKAMAEHQMPPLPEMRDWQDDDLKQFFQEIIDYMAWLGKHFRMEDNFVCPDCSMYYKPTNKPCPSCYPTGPGKPGGRP